MTKREIRNVGVVGAGLVGLGWAIVFARAGARVLVFDANAAIRAAAPERIAASLQDMKSHSLVDDIEGILSRVSVVETIEEAVASADYVQESVLERTDVKIEACAAISRSLQRDAVVGSSSSGIPASRFTEHLANREQFLIVHPVNPPHLVPVVELVPAPWTDPAIVPWLRSEMERLGQCPIVVNREVEGFILNRLQGALLNEAWALFDEGYASAADIDATVSQGLGLRWSFMGPFETIDLNAPGGIDDYARRLGPLYHSVAASRTDPKPWSETAIARAANERRAILAKDDLPERAAWRDRRLMSLIAHRKSRPK